MKRMLLAVAALVVLSACHYVGNGIVPSKVAGDAQFTFDINCPPGQDHATGSLTYIDQAAGVSIRGVPGTQMTFGFGCFTNGDGLQEAEFTGAYQATNRQGGTGTFTVELTPPANNGTNGGTFELTLNGGPYAGYHNVGPVTGHIKAVGGSGA